jgi:hypothetical protein
MIKDGDGDGTPGRTMFFFDLAKEEWDVDEPQLLPDNIPTVDTRYVLSHSTIMSYGY